jgi:membrane protein
MKAHLKKLWFIPRAATEAFLYDNCYLKASALTFYTLLSIVPMLAVGLAIAKGFGYEHTLVNMIHSSFPDDDQLVAQLIIFAKRTIEQSTTGLIAGIGVIALLWTIISLLASVEAAFNDVWKVETGRSYLRKFSDYLAAMIICPILLIVSSSMTVVLTKQVIHATENVELLQTFSPLIFFMLKMIPFILSWALFTFINKTMPNTHVKFSTALLAGMIAGTAYQLIQWGYIHFQFLLSSYGTIYGSFAAVPLFLIWLQLSWVVVLVSAEVAYYSEGHRAQWHLQGIGQISVSAKKLLSVRLVDQVVEAFDLGLAPMTAPELSEKAEIPCDLTRSLLHLLVRGRILSEVSSHDSKERAYLPAKDAKHLTKARIYEALDKDGLSLEELGIPVLSIQE